MSSHNRIVASLCFIFGLTLLGDTPSRTKEDLLTLVALDQEINADFASSAIIYEKLFKQTKNSDYLKKSIESYLANKNYDIVMSFSKENFKISPNIKEYLMYKYIISAMILKKYDDALVIATELEQLQLPQNSGLIGDLYFILGSYDKALKNYEFGYKSLGTANLVLAISNIYYSKLDDKVKAIEYLKSYLEKNGCGDKAICLKLLEYYQYQNNLDGVISMMESIYTSEHKKEHKKEDLAKFELALGELYLQKDKQKGIDFLLQTGNNNLVLASLFEKDRLFDKALEILEKTYKETDDETILGRIAMIEFTVAPDKNIVINDVLNKFEKALNNKSNPEYENFYGYLLIDYDLDVKKGLELVKKAYEAYPDNIAFADSVAWGYFKNNECILADQYISEVVKKAGLDDKEIKLHYDRIKECESNQKK
ncbi:MAG: hypothetical protein L0Y61_01125 [Epsilonproteobacteria bacterium]|nr:hypothetical protein [Campylobacterota bacterium]